MATVAGRRVKPLDGGLLETHPALERLVRVLLVLAVFAAVIGLWEWLCHVVFSDRAYLVPTPAAVTHALKDNAGTLLARVVGNGAGGGDRPAGGSGCRRRPSARDERLALPRRCRLPHVRPLPDDADHRHRVPPAGHLRLQQVQQHRHRLDNLLLPGPQQLPHRPAGDESQPR